MSRLVLTIAGTLLLLISGASAQAPSPEAMSAARKLVVTLKIADQYRALLPQLLLKLRPVVAQDRPEIERDYDAVTAPGSEIYTPALTSMLDQVAGYDGGSSYPPYNIERTGENAYRITLAVAGFSDGELTLEGKETC